MGQSVRDLSSVDKQDLYQGIIYSIRDDCQKANEHLNNFIALYRGRNSDYWLTKAKSYLLDCNQQEHNNGILKYFYRPKFENNIEIDFAELITGHEDEGIPNINIVLDINRYFLSHIVSLSPEIKYPLIVEEIETDIGNPDKVDYVIEEEEFTMLNIDIVLDVYRNTFDCLVGLSPEIKYPLLEENNELVDSENDMVDKQVDELTESDANTDLQIYVPSVNAQQTQRNIKIYSAKLKLKESSKVLKIIEPSLIKKEIADVKIFKQEERSSEGLAALEIYDPYKRSIYKAKFLSNKQKEEGVVQSNSKISGRTTHYRILFNVSKNEGKTYINLSSIGPITSEEMKSGYHLYYVGFFEQRDEAEKALGKVKKLGYKAAEIQLFSEQSKN